MSRFALLAAAAGGFASTAAEPRIDSYTNVAPNASIAEARTYSSELKYGNLTVTQPGWISLVVAQFAVPENGLTMIVYSEGGGFRTAYCKEAANATVGNRTFTLAYPLPVNVAMNISFTVYNGNQLPLNGSAVNVTDVHTGKWRLEPATYFDVQLLPEVEVITNDDGGDTPADYVWWISSPPLGLRADGRGISPDARVYWYAPKTTRSLQQTNTLSLIIDPDGQRRNVTVMTAPVQRVPTKTSEIVLRRIGISSLDHAGRRLGDIARDLEEGEGEGAAVPVAGAGGGSEDLRASAMMWAAAEGGIDQQQGQGGNLKPSMLRLDDVDGSVSMSDSERRRLRAAMVEGGADSASPSATGNVTCTPTSTASSTSTSSSTPSSTATSSSSASPSATPSMLPPLALSVDCTTTDQYMYLAAHAANDSSVGIAAIGLRPPGPVAIGTNWGGSCSKIFKYTTFDSGWIAFPGGNDATGFLRSVDIKAAGVTNDICTAIISTSYVGGSGGIRPAAEGDKIIMEWYPDGRPATEWRTLFLPRALSVVGSVTNAAYFRVQHHCSREAYDTCLVSPTYATPAVAATLELFPF